MISNKKTLIFVGLIIFCFVTDTRSKTAVAPAGAAKTPAGASKSALVSGQKPAAAKKPGLQISDFKVYFEQEIEKTRKRLEVLHQVISNLPKYIKNTSYEESSALRIAEPDPMVPVPIDPTIPPDMIGLVIDFGQSGFGPLTKFTGFTIDIRLDSLPDFLSSLFEDAIKSFLKSRINGKLLVDPKTKRRILKSSPIMEFIFKLVLLAQDMARKNDDLAKIDARILNNQLMLLMYRLSDTPEFKDINDVFKLLPPFFTPLLDQIKIANKSVRTYVMFVWKEFMSIKNYDFTTSDTREMTNKDMPEIVKIMMAIVLRALVDYTSAKNAFVQTPEGKAAAEELKKTGDNAAFNAKMSGFEQVKSDTIAHATSLITRFKAFRVFKARLLARIRPLANDILKPLDMTVDDFFPSEEGALTPEEEAMLAETDAMFAEDPMFGEDLEQFEEIPDEEATAEGVPAAAAPEGVDTAVPSAEAAPAEETWIEGGEEVAYE